MNTKSDISMPVPAADDLMKPAFTTEHAAPDTERFTMTQTSRDPETGKLVTGKEGK